MAEVKQLKMGIIGLGFIGGLHARICAEQPTIDLVAVADLNDELAEKIGKEYGCKVYHDYKEMIKKEDLDAVDICVPEDFHVQTAVDVANMGKDFIIEKPLAKTYAECMTIKECAEKNNVRFMVAQVCKFDPRYAQLKEAIKRGELGEISAITVKRGNPLFTAQRLNGKVSFFYYLGIHDLEMMCDYNLPAKPVRVYAQGTKKMNGHMNGDLDAAFVVVTFDDGSIGNAYINWCYPTNANTGIWASLEVVGSRGFGTVDTRNQGCEIGTDTAGSYPDSLYWPEYMGGIHGDLPAELIHFADATLNGKEYAVNTTSCIYGVAIAEAALKSIESGEVVELAL